MDANTTNPFTDPSKLNIYQEEGQPNRLGKKNLLQVGLAVLLIAGVGLSVYVTKTKKDDRSRASVETTNPQVNLSLTTINQNISPREEFIINVNANYPQASPRTASVLSGVDVTITFNPNAVEFIRSSNQGILQKTFVPTRLVGNNQVHFVMGANCDQTRCAGLRGSSSLNTITFRAKQIIGPTQFTFDPTTKVSVTGQSNNDLGQTTALTVNIRIAPTPPPTPRPSPSNRPFPSPTLLNL